MSDGAPRGPALVTALVAAGLVLLGVLAARATGGAVATAAALVAAATAAGAVLLAAARAGERAEATLADRARAALRGERGGPASPGPAEALLDHLAADAERGRAALVRERALAALVLDGLGQGVIALDDDLRIVQINAAARTLLGLAASPIGEALIDVVRAPALHALVDANRDGETAEIQMAPALRVLARVAAPASGAGRVVILEDVTAIRRLETVRRDFVANVSHELRTPVSVIRANAETLLGGAKDNPAMRAKLIDGLHRNAERLARILADLLDLSRLDAGQYRVELAEVALADAVAAAFGAVEPRARERGIAVVIELDAAIRVLADGKGLDQVLINLIDNAVKYTPPGGHVVIRTAAAGPGRVRLEVADDGPGIAPGHRDRIFERFYRVDAGRSREAGGTGLGLAISKHLIESMDGEIGVAPNTPTGTRFWFELAAPR